MPKSNCQLGTFKNCGNLDFKDLLIFINEGTLERLAFNLSTIGPVTN